MMNLIKKYACFLILILTACGGNANKQLHQGVEIKLLSIERKSHFEQMMKVASTINPEEYEIAVVHVEFTTAEGIKKLELDHSQMILIDSQGNADTSSMDWSFGGISEEPFPWDIAFGVKKNVGLSKLKLGEAEFNLKRFKSIMK